MSEGNKEQNKLNNTLALKLNKSITKGQFKKLRDYFKGPHGVSDVQALEDSTSVNDLIGLLKKDGKIKMDAPDGYNELIDALVLLDERLLAEMVMKFQTDIFNAGTTVANANTEAATHDAKTALVQTQTNDTT